MGFGISPCSREQMAEGVLTRTMVMKEVDAIQELLNHEDRSEETVKRCNDLWTTLNDNDFLLEDSRGMPGLLFLTDVRNWVIRKEMDYARSTMTYFVRSVKNEFDKLEATKTTETKPVASRTRSKCK